jgi:citrate synthase
MGQALREVLKSKGKDLPMNVDGGIAAVLCELGFPPELGNGFFAISRTVGLTAQVYEEITRERPMRQIDQKAYEYDGPPERSLGGR